MAPPGMTNDSCTLVGILSAFVVVVVVVWLQSPTGRLSHNLIIYVGENWWNVYSASFVFVWFCWLVLVGVGFLVVAVQAR